MRELDMSKVCVYMYHGDESVNEVCLVYGTDDPVELEFALEEVEPDDHNCKADSVTLLTRLGYKVQHLKSILVESIYDGPIAHHLVEEDE